ncbi:MAG TPA: GNAT family N-acetyltransferase [Pyrinomonadaceae bacterium]|nr:GNAT family N-acetyltransferase [Pyrinomonadaceae bacterium]
MLETSGTAQLNNRSMGIGSVDAGNVTRLRTGQETEVLNFLSERPIHTVAMMSMIRDNGLTSPFNRGVFYGYRDLNGRLEGVALIGHATLLESVSDRALSALSRVARKCGAIHMIMGEQDRIDEFWSSYSEEGHKKRHSCIEQLFELSTPMEFPGETDRLRLATADEVDLVMPVQAVLAFEESGVNPMKSDPEGFRLRCLRRIQQGRTWVVVDNGALVFKAEVISQTSGVAYLEGIWTRHDKRQNGDSVRFVSELSRKLLQEVNSICLLVNEKNLLAKAFYRKCGFLFRASYKTIFLKTNERSN